MGEKRICPHFQRDKQREISLQKRELNPGLVTLVSNSLFLGVFHQIQ